MPFFPISITTMLAALRRHITLILFLAAGIALIVLTRSYFTAREARAKLEATIAAQQQIVSDANAREATRDAQLHQTLQQIAATKQKVQTPSQAANALTTALPQLIASATGKPLTAPITIEATATTTRQSADKQSSSTNGAGNSPLPQNFAAQQSDSASTFKSQISNLKSSSGITPESGQSASSQPGSTANASQVAQGPGLHIPAEDLKPLFDTVQDCQACRAQLTAAQSDLTDERTKEAALARERDAALQASRGGTFWTRARKAAKWLLIGAAAGATAGVLASAHHHP